MYLHSYIPRTLVCFWFHFLRIHTYTPRNRFTCSMHKLMFSEQHACSVCEEVTFYVFCVETMGSSQAEHAHAHRTRVVYAKRFPGVLCLHQHLRAYPAKAWSLPKLTISVFEVLSRRAFIDHFPTFVLCVTCVFTFCVFSTISLHVYRVVFLYCCPHCPSCPVYAVQMGRATWAIWTAINKYSQYDKFLY